MCVLRNKKILVAPLNWGLGHASRCVPLITRLQKQGNAIAIASDGIALDLLQKNFPKLTFFTLPSYNINYRYRSMEVNMLLQGPKIQAISRAELKATAEIVDIWKPDIIISDNRFGVRHRCCRSIFLTHQLMVIGRNSLATSIATWLHQSLIVKFDECWVPDYEGDAALAGKMSQAKLSIPVNYLGPLSRIVRKPTLSRIDILAVLSGPEPQRTYLEDILFQATSSMTQYRIHIVRGVHGSRSTDQIPDHITFSSIADTTELNELLNTSRLIVCRPGYSSMMDLEVLDSPAILIPTPGQHEQEYLAKRADAYDRFVAIEQDRLLEDFEHQARKMLR